MISRARTTIPLVLPAILATALLAGCSGAPSPEPEPDPGATATPSEGSTAQDACVVGEWTLDVARYRADSESYLLALPLPIEGFDLTGFGIITFTADGLVTTDVDLTSTGTIVAGDTRVPFNTPSRYTASGDWSVGDGDIINLANWSSEVDHDPLADPDAAGAPAIDYTDIPSVMSSCSEHELTLVVPGAPLETTWFR